MKHNNDRGGKKKHNERTPPIPSTDPLKAHIIDSERESGDQEHQAQLNQVHSVGSNTNLTTGRTISSARVKTRATLTRPSLPGNNFITRPSHQDNGGLWLSITITKLFTLRFGASEVHLDRSWRVVRYSDDQRRQKV